MQQLGQKFLRKYHCPVCPVVCWWHGEYSRRKFVRKYYRAFGLHYRKPLNFTLCIPRFLYIHVRRFFLETVKFEDRSTQLIV